MAERKTSSKSSKAGTSKPRSTSSTRKRTTTKSSNGRAKYRMTKEEIAEQSAFHDEFILVSSLVISILLVLANFGMGGVVGSSIHKFFRGIFGMIAYILPVLLFVGVAFHISNRGNQKANKKIVTGIILMISMMAFFQLMSGQPNLKISEVYEYSTNHIFCGGFVGGMICSMLTPLFGEVGTYVILIAVLLICFMMFTGKTIVTALSKKGERSIIDMKERYVENASLRQEYRQQVMEEKQKQREQARERKKAKTFDLKKTYEVDQATGEIKGEPLNEEPIQNEENESMVQNPLENQTKKSKKTKKQNTEKNSSVDMEEIQPNLEGMSISGDYVSLSQVPTYEDELNRKFGKQPYGGMEETITDDLKQQVVSMMEDYEGAMTSVQPEIKEQSYDESTVMAEPVSEPRISIQPIEEVKSTYEIESMKEQESVGGYCFDGVEIEETTSPSTEEQIQNPEDTIKHQQESIHQNQKVQSTSKIEEGMEEVENLEEKVLDKPHMFPSLDLLTRPKKAAKGMTEHDLKETAAKLQTTLESFGVRAAITNVTCGPAVTRYEIQPEQGVKVSAITKLSDDIKLNLAATDIRIEAPIPGKAAVGIEVPNKVNTTVLFRELIENKEFMEHPSSIAFAVGKDISGRTIISDIAKMPHLLIAGATGSGKSVCINTLIMSILYKADPRDVKMIMVDPKVVELSIYNGIPHLMIPVVTDPKKASSALNWAVVEMDRRYNLFAELAVRDMKSYNEKIGQVEHYNDPRYKKMPQLVIIIDELADLMMVAKGDVEEAIVRLAQKARAAGIHLVIATQRPSVNVITGLIKANVPSRIAFAVSSAVDSRTIIDGSGAEKLLGKGDMLFAPAGAPKPVRLQGAFISDDEVNAVVEFLKENNTQEYSTEMNDTITTGGSPELALKSNNDKDEYFAQAGKFIIEKNKASIGMLQRVYKIGFNRAARIMDQLCEAGVVGPEEGTKPRKVLMSMDEFDQYIEEYL